MVTPVSCTLSIKPEWKHLQPSTAENVDTKMKASSSRNYKVWWTKTGTNVQNRNEQYYKFRCIKNNKFRRLSGLFLMVWMVNNPSVTSPLPQPSGHCWHASWNTHSQTFKQKMTRVTFNTLINLWYCVLKWGLGISPSLFFVFVFPYICVLEELHSFNTQMQTFLFKVWNWGMNMQTDNLGYSGMWLILAENE